VTTTDLTRYEMRRAPSLDGLCELVAERHARGEETVLLAGGTDWMVEQEMRPPLGAGAQTPLVVDVSRLEALRGIALDGDTLRVGAAATYLEMRRSEAVTRRAPLLARMAADVGAIQIQARGTLGGNLATASPAADGVAGIAPFDPTIVVRSVHGERRIPFAALQTGYKKSTRAPDEVFVAIELPLPPEGSPWLWRKVGTRRAQAISKVALGAIAVVEGGRATRVGLGMASVAPVTALLPKTRALLGSKPLAALTDAEIDAAVGEDVAPIDDVRSTREYRLHCARAVVRGFVAALRG
jgi:CO/xanthine dehydrogenase FAD-binding subunit